MTVEELLESAQNDAEPPPELSREAQALWHAKAGNWEASHNIAQDIPSAMGSWIHAHLHLIEGDLGNAGYWYRRADRPARSPEQIPDEWLEIASEVLATSN